MSRDSNSDYVCDFYDHPPVAHGVPLPGDLQSILSECVFVEDGQLVDLATAARHMGSMAAVEAACHRCGKCCYGLQQARYPNRPATKCAHILCQIGLGPHLLKPAAEAPTTRDSKDFD